jgi:uncharacterized pyridoxamine 5'-phosphate oxidase family protein
MKSNFLYNFISKHRNAVLSTVASDGTPESALVGFAVAPDLRIIFDTVSTSRKYKNLNLNHSVAFVIGWDNEQTVQYEGRVVFQAGNEFNKMIKLYFRVFPDGKQRYEKWNDIAYFVVVPEWIRYSDFNDPPVIEETDFLPNKLNSAT